MKAEKALFKLENFKFEKVYLDNSNADEDIELVFDPSGQFFFENGAAMYDLIIIFQAFLKEGRDKVIEITFKASYSFENVESISQIPPYFYGNSIAIVFPYIRAFISNLTMQSNDSSKLLILPTMNLSSLAEPLKNNTAEK